MPELLRYEPSGRVGVTLVPGLPAALALAAVLGAGYQEVLDENPLVVLDVALPVVLGFALAAVSVLGLVVGKVRRRGVARLLAAAVAAAGYAAAWARALGFGRADFAGFGPAFGDLLAQGDAMPGQTATLGPGVLVIAWGFEAAAVLAAAAAVPLVWWGRAVFCEDTGRFVRRDRVGTAYGPSPFALRQAVQDRGLEALLDIGLRPGAENEREGELRLYAHRCRAATYLTVFWRGQLDHPRGRRMTRDVLVLRRVRVGDGFLDELAASRRIAPARVARRREKTEEKRRF